MKKWNILDVFVILGIIAFVGGGVYQAARLQGKMSDQEKFKEKVKLEGQFKEEAKKELLVEYEAKYNQKIAEQETIKRDTTIKLQGYEEGYKDGYKKGVKNE